MSKRRWLMWFYDGADHGPSHAVEVVTKLSRQDEIYHTVCGLTFYLFQEKSGPFAYWRFRDIKVPNDCPACVRMIEEAEGFPLGNPPRTIWRSDPFGLIYWEEIVGEQV
jgi:hypothetical protein